MELDTFLNLLPDGFFRLTIGWIEGRITAKGTATRTDFAVAVGTIEARVDADFLHAPPELLREVVAVAVETAAVAPRISHFESMIWIGIGWIVQKCLIRQRVQKRLQLGFFLVSQSHATLHHMVHQRTDGRRVFYAIGVEINDLVQGGEAAVVHVGCRNGDVAQGRGFVDASVGGIARDGVAVLRVVEVVVEAVVVI